MRAKVRSYRPSHAVVVAYLSLFVALGGSSYAAIKVTGKNVKNSSLTGKDVKNNSLKGPDVNGLGTGDIRDSSLLARDFKPGQLPAGPQGVQGAPGRDATKVFAYIKDRSGASDVLVHYGRGVAAVSEDSGEGSYVVSFDRSVANCVVHATTGLGNPRGDAWIVTWGIPLVTMDQEVPTRVRINFIRNDATASDTSFFVTAFCP